MNPPSPPAGVLLFGFGFVGRTLAERFYLSGIPVRAVKRRCASDDVNLPLAVDFTDLSARPWQPEWAGYPSWALLLPPSQLTGYADAVEHLATRAAEHGVRHLLFASSISVYGDEARRCDENSSLNPQTESARQIAAAEQACLSSGVVAVDILRLGGLYAAERHPLERLLARGGAIAGGNRPANMLHRDAAVDAFFQAALNPNGRRIRNLVATPHPSRCDFYTAEAAKLGLPPPQFDPDDGSSGKTVFSLYGSEPYAL
jgi:hypothetical protein